MNRMNDCRMRDEYLAPIPPILRSVNKTALMLGMRSLRSMPNQSQNHSFSCLALIDAKLCNTRVVNHFFDCIVGCIELSVSHR